MKWIVHILACVLASASVAHGAAATTQAKPTTLSAAKLSPTLVTLHLKDATARDAFESLFKQAGLPTQNPSAFNEALQEFLAQGKDR